MAVEEQEPQAVDAVENAIEPEKAKSGENGKSGENVVDQEAPDQGEEKNEDAPQNAERETAITAKNVEEPTNNADSASLEGGARTGEENSGIERGNTDIKPIGRGIFGYVYNQFKNKVKEGIEFLLSHKSGNLLGVFHRDDIGDINLVWGDENGGLSHIIERHLVEQNDFKDINEVALVLNDVINNGKIERENPDKLVIDYSDYRVVVRKQTRDAQGNVVEYGNWVVTAFDKSRSKEEKTSSGKTLTTPLSNRETDGVTLPSNDVSVSKDNEKNWDLFESGEEIWENLLAESGGDNAMAEDVAQSVIEDKEEEKKKLEKKKIRKGGSVGAKIRAERDRREAIERLDREIGLWKGAIEYGRLRQLNSDSKSDAVSEEVSVKGSGQVEVGMSERVPNYTDDKPSDARARGYKMVEGTRVNRQTSTPLLEGGATEVKFSESKNVRGHYVVLESEDLIPSHRHGQVNVLHFLPEAQPKRRTDAVSADMERKIASNINADEITRGVTAYTGSPIVNERGEVIQGNNRSASLMEMYESYRDESEKYKSYLLEHAKEFGLDASVIARMAHPVLARKLDVSDSEAIRLGQYDVKDTESGGVERIKSGVVITKMQSKMRTFFNILFNGDEEMSVSEAISKNGVLALKWLVSNKYISDTQYKSAFDSKGNLSGDAISDLRNILFWSVFRGGNEYLEEKFAVLPIKAQRAILSTAYRDYASDESERFIGEIQESINCYYDLMQDKGFASATTDERVRKAIEMWRRQYSVDFYSGESVLNGKKYSDVVLELALLYKLGSQSYITNVFNSVFDIVQGTSEMNMFDAEATSKRPLRDAVSEVLRLEKYNDVKKGRTNETTNGEPNARRQEVEAIAPSNVERLWSNDERASEKPREGADSESDDRSAERQGDNGASETRARDGELSEGEETLDNSFSKKPLFRYFEGSIKSLIEASKKRGSGLIKSIISSVSDKLRKDLIDLGVDITSEYNHTIDNNAINHSLKRHSSESERLQGQVPITELDIEKVADVIDNYDSIKVDENKRGQKVIVYSKKYSDGTTIYVEEVRKGRKELAMVSMRKKATRTDANSNATPISDLNSLLLGKDNKESSFGQVKSKKKSENRLVSDERYEELKQRMRKKLGQLNMGVDPEILAIGTEMAVYHIEKGARAFGEYARAMISDLGDAVRPYLKAFYNGARDMPEMEELSKVMTEYEEVRQFDVASIGANGEDVTATLFDRAEQISNEAEVERNEKEEAKETSEESDVDNEMYSITKQHNAKKGIDIWVVRGKERTDKDVYMQRKQKAKSHNGYYSSFRGVNGFVFNSVEEAKAFSDDVFAEDLSQVVESEDKELEKEEKPFGRISTKDDLKGLKDKIFINPLTNSVLVVGFFKGADRVEARLNGEIVIYPWEELANELNSGAWEEREYVGLDLLPREKSSEDNIKDLQDYEIGDKVMYKGKEATLYGVEAGQPVLDVGLAPIMYETTSWDKISPVEENKKSAPEQRDSVDRDIFSSNNLKETDNDRSRESHSGIRFGREELSKLDNVGSRAPLQDAQRDSQGERLRPDNGGGELGTRPKYDVNKKYSNEEIDKIVLSVTAIEDGKVVITGEVTDDLRGVVRGYESGGVAKQGRGVLDEYYTDGKIVDAVGNIIAPLLPANKLVRVLEPSVGIGNFLGAIDESKTSEIATFEINRTTAGIAKILHPNIEVNLRSFETEFIDEDGNKKTAKKKYDVVIGNPPYGSHRGLYKGLGEEPKISRYEDYFVKRSLDVMNEGGVLAMVLPSSWLDRQKHSYTYDLLRAYRLPSGAFAGTNVGTDIIVLKKASNAKSIDISDYFETHPERVLGEEKERRGRFGRIEKYISGDIDVALDAISRDNAIDVANALDMATDNDTLDNIERAIEETGSSAGAKKIVEEEKRESLDREASETSSEATKKVSSVKVHLKKGGEIVDASVHFNTSFSSGEVEAFKDTSYDGIIENWEAHKEHVSYYAGKYMNDFYYAEGDIYGRLAQLARDKEFILETMGQAQYDKQSKMLYAVLPKRKSLDEITLSPNTTFVNQIGIGENNLIERFISFLGELPYSAFGDSSKWEVEGYVYNEQVYGKDADYNRVVRSRRKKVGNALFKRFLKEELTDSERGIVENAFNREYNGTYRPDYSRVPMFSKIRKEFKGKELKLTSVQLAGVGRSTVKGVGVLAHEVGFGKTLSGVMSMHEAMTRGNARKPLIIVPNDNIMRQWIETIEEALPEATINVLGNLGVKYDLSDFNVNDGEFSIVTYEGLKSMSFSDETYDILAKDFSYITDDLNSHKSVRDAEKAREKQEELKGKLRKGSKKTYNFEEFGFDYLTFDEVHNANHIVSKVKLDKSEYSDFRSQSQRSSDLGIKTWLAAQYIQRMNKGRNVLLLSATPFTNKPLEYYSILSLVANDTLKRKGFYKVDEFFKTFMEADDELEITASGKPLRKTNIRRFRNNGLFQDLLSEYIDIKGEEDNPDLVRPERKNKEYKLSQNDETKAAMLQVEGLLEDNKSVLQGIGLARQVAFTPYAALGMPSGYKEFVEKSPKIDATIKLISQNKKDAPNVGQIIYSEVCVETFPLIRDYLIKETGYKENEVRIITGATSNSERVKIQGAFNSGEVKVVIGSPAIKEGLNLQGNTTDMYILSLPWNFTQLRQIEGRGWRQGNKWKNIRINYMLTEDSVDVFMLQRLQLKQGLYNEAMKKGSETIDVGDIEASELKAALIKDPKTRAHISVSEVDAKINDEITRLKSEQGFIGRKTKTYIELLSELKTAKENVESRKDSEYFYNYYKGRVDNLTKKLGEERDKLSQKGVEIENIVGKLTKIEDRIETLKSQISIESKEELFASLTEQYTKEREEQLSRSGHSLSDYLKERSEENSSGFFEERRKTDGLRFREEQDLEETNERFNETLDGLTLENADKVVLSLGRPSELLQKSGVKNKELKLYGNKVLKKMRKHGFALEELRDLPKAVADPIAVFDNYRIEGNRTILTELHTQGRNIVVVITLGKSGVDVDFNIVSSVFGKGYVNIIDWFNKGYATYINKEKALDYLYFSERSISEASNNEELLSAAKVIENFDNEALFRENNEKDLLDDAWLEMSIAEKRLTGERLARDLGLGDVVFVGDGSAFEGRQARAKGWYDVSSGRITIVLGNHRNELDLERTLLHEGVAHYGLRALLGKDRLDEELLRLYNSLDKATRRNVVDLSKKRGWDIGLAMEEYLAGLVEDGRFKDAKRVGAWTKIKEFFRRLFIELGLLDLGLRDNDLRGLLYESYLNLQRDSVFKEAERAVVLDRLGLGERTLRKRNVEEILPAQETTDERRLYSGDEVNNMSDELSPINSIRMPRKARHKVKELLKGKPITKNNVWDVMRILEKGIDDVWSSSSISLRKIKKSVDLADYFDGTIADFKAINKNIVNSLEHYINAFKEWEELKKDPSLEWHKSPLSNSEYLINTETGDIYRFADHWGEVASCTWHLDRDYYDDKTFESRWNIGVANIADFKAKDWGRLRYLKASVIRNLNQCIVDYRDVLNDGSVQITDAARAMLESSLSKKVKLKEYFKSRNSVVAIRYRDDELEEVNARFNAELDRLIADPKGKNRVLYLGFANKFLQEGGLVDAEIFLDFDKLVRKANENYKSKHPFNLYEIYDLPIAVHEPIAMFKDTNGRNDGSIILTELENNGNNFVVAIKTSEKKHKGNVVLEVNEVSTLHPKEAKGIIYWVINNKLSNVDKEKALSFIEALQSHSGTTINERELSMATKVINNFDNRQVNLKKDVEKELKNTKVDNNLLFREELDAEKGSEKVVDVVNYNDEMSKRSTRFVESWQDSMVSLKHFTSSVLQLRGNGEEMDESEDAYSAENLMHGRNRADAEEFERDYYEPLVELIKSLMEKSSLDYETLQKVLMGTHGLERNRLFALRDTLNEIYESSTERAEVWKAIREASDGRDGKHWLDVGNEHFEKAIESSLGAEGFAYFKEMRTRDYSGLIELFVADEDNENETDDIVEEIARKIFEREESDEGSDVEETNEALLRKAETSAEDYRNRYSEALAPLWDAIKGANNYNLRKGLESGLLSYDRYVLLRDMFEHYVPLRGYSSETASDLYSYYASNSGGFSKLDMRAKGRTSVSDDPIATIFNIGLSTIILGNRNIVKRRFYNFVKNHPTNMSVVVDQWYKNIGTEESPDWRAVSADIPEGSSSEEIEASFS